MDEDGVMHPMSFPPRESAHKEMSHFYINSVTGEPFKEIPAEERHWPMEKVTRKLAKDIMRHGFLDETGVKRKPATFNSAFQMAKEVQNSSARTFNNTKRDNGDDFHTVPLPFQEDGSLHPEYMTNHYGAHQSRRIPTVDRQTRDEQGRLINLNTNNKPHKTLGLHLESHAFHHANEFNDEVEKRGIQTDIGAKQNVLEPQHITGGVTRRYSSNEKDPTSKHNTTMPSYYKDRHAQEAAFGQIRPEDIISVLPNDFFYPSSSGNMSTRIRDLLIDEGYDDETAYQMARAPVNQLLYGSGEDGRQTGLRLAMKAMADRLNIHSNPDVENIYTRQLHDIAMQFGGADKGRTKAAAEIMAMLKTAEAMGMDPRELSSKPPAPQRVVEGWQQHAQAVGGKPIDMASLGVSEEMHSMRGKFNDNPKHLYDSFPAHLTSGSIGAEPQERDDDPDGGARPPDEELSVLPPAPEDDPQPPLGGGFAGIGGGVSGFGGGISATDFRGPDAFAYSDDDPMGVIATIMERVQLHDAGGSLLRKYDPLSALDMARLGDEVGVPSITVRAIAMSLGDWGVIAKSFNTTRDVVRVIKKSCGGAING
ncbi:MAG: hypothetical protein CL581_05210 [Alteromonadaceae bacterium]|nr:hypothetical protein [Alteromonadaceae bacterium]